MAKLWDTILIMVLYPLVQIIEISFKVFDKLFEYDYIVTRNLPNSIAI